MGRTYKEPREKTQLLNNDDLSFLLPQRKFHLELLKKEEKNNTRENRKDESDEHDTKKSLD